MKFLPESTWLGLLGGGQLGRMLCQEARSMGYRVITWSGGGDAQPASVSNIVINEPFDCPKALATFLERADVVTVEFENIPKDLLEALEEQRPMAPSPTPVIVCQHREREKTFLSEHGFPCAWYRVVDSPGSLADALRALPKGRGILKTAEFGYDGKGQQQVSAEDDANSVWDAFDAPRAVLEEHVALAGELSVLVARGRDGQTVCYDAAENIHRRHILDLSIVPARYPEAILAEAQKAAVGIAEKLDYCGIMAVEFFLTEDQRIIVNEMAPRPHNSGHHTLDACATSQFEQPVRAMCDLPLGQPTLLKPAVMWNLLGDLWQEDGTAPDWSQILAIPEAKLHLYDKRKARVGRKMGHVTFLGDTIEEALERAMHCRKVFGWSSS